MPMSSRRQQQSELLRFRGKAAARTETLLGTAAFIGLIVLWQLAASFELMPARFLPGPIAVVEALGRMLFQNDFLSDIGISIIRVWVAFLLSVIMAVPLGNIFVP